MNTHESTGYVRWLCASNWGDCLLVTGELYKRLSVRAINILEGSHLAWNDRESMTPEKLRGLLPQLAKLKGVGKSILAEYEAAARYFCNQQEQKAT